MAVKASLGQPDLDEVHSNRGASIMKRRLAALVVAVSTFATAPAVAPVLNGSPVTPSAAVGKTCSTGYKHAVISGSHKCLRRGQFCARAKDSTYHRYGLHCHKRDASGNYHLT